MTSRLHVATPLVCIFLTMAGCPASNQPDGSIDSTPDTMPTDTRAEEAPIPDIPPATRIVDLDDAQLMALCEYWLAMLGTSGERCTNGQDYTLYLGTDYYDRYDPIGYCIDEYHLTRDLRPDCPQLVRSDIRFIQHVKAHCHDPDFNALDFDGHMGCTGP